MDLGPQVSKTETSTAAKQSKRHRAAPNTALSPRQRLESFFLTPCLKFEVCIFLKSQSKRLKEAACRLLSSQHFLPSPLGALLQAYGVSATPLGKITLKNCIVDAK